MYDNDVIQRVMLEKVHTQLLLDRCELELRDLPAGSLVSSGKRGGSYFYQRIVMDGKVRRIYLSKENDRTIIDGLVRKGYLLKLLPILKKNVTAAERFLNKYTGIDPSETFGTLSPAYQAAARGESASVIPRERLAAYYEELGDIDIAAWIRTPYKKSQMYQDELRQRTMEGQLVRSKSEMNIANAFELYHIPYRYEPELDLGLGFPYYPDFETLRPRDRKHIWLEHFGLLNDPKYVQKMDRKLKHYREAGIVPWDNLLITYEKDGAINMQEITAMIRAVYL